MLLLVNIGVPMRTMLVATQLAGGIPPPMLVVGVVVVAADPNCTKCISFVVVNPWLWSIVLIRALVFSFATLAIEVSFSETVTNKCKKCLNHKVNE